MRSLSASRVGFTGLGGCFLSTNNCLPPPMLCCWYFRLFHSMGLPLWYKKTLLNVVKESFLYQWVNPLNERASLTRHSGNHLCVLGKHLLKVSKLKEAKVCKELLNLFKEKLKISNWHLWLVAPSIVSSDLQCIPGRQFT